MALEAGGDGVINDEDNIYEVYTLPNDIGTVKKYFEKNGVNIISSEVGYYPDDYITPADEAIPMIEKLIVMLEENDDVQNVYHNADLPEEEDDEWLRRNFFLQ